MNGQAPLERAGRTGGVYPERPRALDSDAPADNTQHEGAETALAEARALGGSVILRLTSVRREGLTRGDARATAAWEWLKQVAGFLRARGNGLRESASTLAIAGPQWGEEFEEIGHLAWRQQLEPRSEPKDTSLRTAGEPLLHLESEPADS
ncbi:MAG: hypothetical protein KatS3mg004_3586 [Bryobacteraceae bacterium]|nr:MAG: hypothetical protein KatS3mg004_3586 [Bryobacteraceae bacterium]